MAMTRSRSHSHTPPVAERAGELDALVGRIEHSTALGRVGDLVAGVADRVLPGGNFRDAMSGVPIGHPLHPAVVALPIGSWVAATWLDLTRGDARAAKRLTALGVVSALPAALSGTNDWLSTAGAERRIGTVHGALNGTGVVLYTASWLAPIFAWR